MILDIHGYICLSSAPNARSVSTLAVYSMGLRWGLEPVIAGGSFFAIGDTLAVPHIMRTANMVLQQRGYSREGMLG